MTTSNERMAWIDCEMTGLDLSADELVEIAIVITDVDLTPVHEGLSLVIKPQQTALEQMSDFVIKMHTESGLIEEIPHGISVEDAEQKVLDYLRTHVPSEQRAPLAGNSIGTDRTFLAQFMPQLNNHLHYRNIDVSSIKELARRWFPRVYFNAPQKKGGHRALVDIRESIRELDYYRSALFVSTPGPTSSEAQTLATKIMEEWATRM